MLLKVLQMFNYCICERYKGSVRENDLSVKRHKQVKDKKAQKRKAEEDKLSELENCCKGLKTVNRKCQEMYDKSKSTCSVSFVTQGSYCGDMLKRSKKR